MAWYIGINKINYTVKGITLNLNGQWRYCIGDYRVIAENSDEKITILVLTIEDKYIKTE